MHTQLTTKPVKQQKFKKKITLFFFLKTDNLDALSEKVNLWNLQKGQ